MIDRNESERENIEMLLPWYETGTLAPEQMRRVEAYLARHPELRSQIALIREELSETVAANESLGMPRSAVRDRLMAQIAEEAGAAGGQPVAPAWWRSLLPRGASPAWAIAAAAACLIIIVQAAALISLGFGGAGESRYRTAGGETPAAASGTFIFVSFADGAKATEIAELLQSIKGVIVDGPKPGGAYKVRISPRALTVEERDAIIEKLRARTDVIAFAALAG